jgi:O-methyltransferase
MILRQFKKLVPLKYKKYFHFIKLYNHLTYAKDGLYTIHNPAFIKDEEFKKAYYAGKATGSWGGDDIDIEWRAHTAIWAAEKAFKLEGDFVECGVNRGGLSRAIIEYLNFGTSGKRFYLLDTFEGFDTSLLVESEKKKYDNKKPYAETYDVVKKIFEKFDNVNIIKGAVPYTLPQVLSEKVSYLSIDMNCVQPETATLDFFWPKMVSGGVVVLDDFAYSQHEEQNIAHTAWSKANNINILSLPTGQGLIIKP